MGRFRNTAYLGALALILGAGTAGAATPSRGRLVALDICSACHVVPDAEFEPALDPPATPLRDLANRPGVNAKWLRNAIAKTHPMATAPREMPNPMLTPDQIAAVADYIMSLKERR